MPQQVPTKAIRTLFNQVEKLNRRIDEIELTEFNYRCSCGAMFNEFIEEKCPFCGKEKAC